MAYGLLGAPLAMAALPVYIHAPKLYGDELGLGLALTGAILLASRAVDTLQDPWLGRLADHLQRRPGGWPLLAVAATLCLGFAYAALFNPPIEAGHGLALWFGVTLVLVYTAHSALNITYLAWGANASSDSQERTRLVAYREGFSILGVILASLLPMLFAIWFEEGRWLPFSGLFALLLVAAVWLLLQQAPRPRSEPVMPQRLLQPLVHEPFRRLATLFLLNGLAVAMAGTLALFYIADVLRLEAYSGAFLAVYFLSGAASLPFWLSLARRLGRSVTWALGTLVAVVGFVWATQLGSGDWLAYGIICLLSGAALGADLALPAAIAADIIPPRERGRAASYFGIWSLINKGVLALAAGLGLPLLAGFGYQPGGESGLLALSLFYAGVPCLIKLLSAVLLMRWRQSLEVRHAL
ncbi:MAG: MFS transporter [Candidatus Thiodiazotropha sp.]|jgi:GPH family glycoside/pentoside/hexuronide:cation symporter